MTTTLTTTALTTGATLAELEFVERWLWASEPLCDAAERGRLLARLSDVSMAVERLVFRHELHPDEPLDAATVAECAAELSELARRWPTAGPRPAAAA